MIRHYFRVAIRSILKHRLSNALNIIGLTLGLTVSIILGSYCSNEYTYDSFNENNDRIFQFWASVQIGPNAEFVNTFTAGTAPDVKNKYTGVEAFARVKKVGTAQFSYAGFKSLERNIIFADAAIFDIFTLPLDNGEYNSLSSPNNVALSASMATKIFGNQDPIGKLLIYSDSVTLKVVSVFKDIPRKSSLKCDFIVSISTLLTLKDFNAEMSDNSFGLGSFEVYFLLDSKYRQKPLEEIIPKIETPWKINSYHLEQLKGAHLRNYAGDTSSKFFLFATIAIASFVICVVNSVSLITAQNIVRSKEMIVRKINGASKASIVYLFCLESIITSLIALIFAFVLAWAMVGFIRENLHIDLEWKFFFDKQFIYFGLSAFLILISCGGLYPGLVLSTTNPVLSLTAVHTQSRFSDNARRVTIIFQFVVTTLLILGAFIVQSQLTFIENKDLGLDIRNVITFHLEKDEAQKYPVIRNRIIELSGVSEVAATNLSLFEDPPTIALANRIGSDAQIPVSILYVDPHFADLMKIEWIHKGDGSKGVILNETAISSLSLTKEPIGSEIQLFSQRQRISSVVKDFNYSGLKQKIGNLSIYVTDDSAKIFNYIGCNVYVKFANVDLLRNEISEIQKLVGQISPGKPFIYQYLENKRASNFAAEAAILSSFKIFTGVSILIASFGLVGLLTFNISNRMNELSIRKILGAGSFQLAYVISREVLVMVSISFAIAIPTGIYFFNKWLQTFIYKTSITFESVFVCLLLIMIMSATITLLFAKRAINVNPLKFIRKE